MRTQAKERQREGQEKGGSHKPLKGKEITSVLDYHGSSEERFTSAKERQKEAGKKYGRGKNSFVIDYDEAIKERFTSAKERQREHGKTAPGRKKDHFLLDYQEVKGESVSFMKKDSGVGQTRGRLKTRFQIELPLWSGFVLRKIAERKKKSVSELIEDSMSFLLKDYNPNQIKLWSFEFRRRYKKWLDE